MKFRLPVIFLMAFLFFSKTACAMESSYSGNFVVPDSQSGVQGADYEIQVGKKFERGALNFFFGWLELPHSIKGEYRYRKQEYLPAGFETFFIGTFKGILNSFGRTTVGVYEVLSSPYPQEPVLEEMEEWLY